MKVEAIGKSFLSIISKTYCISVALVQFPFVTCPIISVLPDRQKGCYCFSLEEQVYREFSCLKSQDDFELLMWHHQQKVSFSLGCFMQDNLWSQGSINASARCDATLGAETSWEVLWRVCPCSRINEVRLGEKCRKGQLGWSVKFVAHEEIKKAWPFQPSKWRLRKNMVGQGNKYLEQERAVKIIS